MLQSLMLRISDVLVIGDDLSLTPALTVLVGSGDRHLKVSMLLFPHVPLKTFPVTTWQRWILLDCSPLLSVKH